jgi:hypothetical protein
MMDLGTSTLGGASNLGVKATLAALVERDDDLDSQERPQTAPTYPLGWFTRALIALATIKVAAAFVLAVAHGLPAGSAIPTVVSMIGVLAFGGAAAVLLVAHAGDQRTADLGVVLLLVASAYGVGLADLGSASVLGTALAPVYPDAFLPFFMGRFIQGFPCRRVEDGWDRGLAVLVQVCLGAGIALFSANALIAWTDASGVPALGILERRRMTGALYWTIVFGLLSCVIPIAFARLRHVDLQERRRAKWFLTGFLGGLLPTAISIVLGAIPAIKPWISAPTTLAWLAPLVWAGLASIPITVSYSVLVRRVLPLRVVLRNGLAYVLARGTVLVAFAVPVVLLIAYAYRHRHETIATAMAGPGAWLLAGVGVSGAIVFWRDWLVRTIDRVFFRETYDAREILINLTERTQRVRQLDELVALLSAGVDRAFQPDHLAVMIRDKASARFISPFAVVEPLPARSLLVQAIQAAQEPVDTRLNDRRSPLRWLPRRERQWMVDCGATCLVPIRTTDDTLVGLIALGDRKNEEPYGREDKRLLQAIADTGALVIENQAMRAVPSAIRSGDDQFGLDVRSGRAAECPTCGAVYHGGSVRCELCGKDLLPANVPFTLLGKFRFERRVGRGGMGVVYQATDLALDRPVAVKTLPTASPERANRLRGEAKAMAAVTHPHLATIHGIETWRGQPLLICEYMANGTLADRLATHPMRIPEALALGIQLAEALTVVHDAGLLHRDIKPSNIGYLDRHTPKLLDFGLVHILLETRPTAGFQAEGPPQGNLPLSSLSVTQTMAGTPLYLSPEALRGEPPSAAFDLWSLNVLLLEAIVGRHPLRGLSLSATFDRIKAADFGSALGFLDDDSDVAAYFRRALAPGAASRPSRARDVAMELRRLTN